MRAVIIGAGFAGLSTAYHLARRRAGTIVVLERESGFGMHASGRNAGLLRQSSGDEALLPLLRSGSRAARRLLRDIPGAFAQRGSLILGEGAACLKGGPRSRMLDAAAVLPGHCGRALFDPEDGTLDPQALLGVYAQGARRGGAEISFGEPVTGIAKGKDSPLVVHTGRRAVKADQVIIAAGAWAGQVAALAGSSAVEVTSLRRHIFRGRLRGAETGGWPFVWNESAGVYFRPEGTEMLLSPCDSEPQPAGSPSVDPAQRDILAAKLAGTFADLGTWSIGTGWACLRTFAPDQRFVIGPDPGVRGLFWVACLGGHGVTTSWAVGRLAARTLLGRPATPEFAPGR